MAIEYPETSDEDVTGQNEKWLEIAAARRKIFELEELSLRFRVELASALFVLSMVIGGFSEFFAGVFAHEFSGNISPLWEVAGVIGIFALGVSLVQLVTVLWEIRKSRQLRMRLAQAVDEASLASTMKHPAS